MADALRRVGSLLGCKVECRLSLAAQHTDCRRLAEVEEGSSYRLGNCLADGGCSLPAGLVEAVCSLVVWRHYSGHHSHGHSDRRSVGRRMVRCIRRRPLALLKVSFYRTLMSQRSSRLRSLSARLLSLRLPIS